MRTGDHVRAPDARQEGRDGRGRRVLGPLLLPAPAPATPTAARGAHVVAVVLDLDFEDRYYYKIHQAFYIKAQLPWAGAQPPDF